MSPLWFGRRVVGFGQAPHSAPLAELLDTLRNEPRAFYRRPVVRTLSRDVIAYRVSHPSLSVPAVSRQIVEEVRTRQEGREIGALWLQSLTTFLSEPDPEGERNGAAVGPAADAPQLLRLLPGTILRRDADDLLTHLPAGSAVLFDIGDLHAEPDVSAWAADHVRAQGLLVGVNGLQALAQDGPALARVRPEVLAYDVLRPLDYQERAAAMEALRETAAERHRILVDNVDGPVDEWAATSLGATMMAGSYVEAPVGSPARAETTTPFLLAVERHASRNVDRSTVMAEGLRLARTAQHEGRVADVYACLRSPADLTADVRAACLGLLDAGAAVTLVAPGLAAPPLPGVAWGAVPADHPMANEVVIVVLSPGQGCLMAALALGARESSGSAPGAARGLRPRGASRATDYAYVLVEDRVLALRAAGLITEHVPARPAT